MGNTPRQSLLFLLAVLAAAILDALRGPSAFDGQQANPLVVFYIISAIAAAASGAMQYQSSKRQAKQADEVARYNAEMARREANRIEQERAGASRQERSEARRRRAAIEASYAKAGVTLGGTPEQMLLEQAGADEWNAAQGDQRARVAATDAWFQGSVAKAEAGFLQAGYRAQGNAALVGAVGSAASSMTSAYGAQGPAKAPAQNKIQTAYGAGNHPVYN